MTALLAVRDLVAGYGEQDILHGVTLHVDAGEIVAIIGPNGAGKSTLLRAIVGLLPARGGAIWFRDRNLAGVNPAELIASGLAYVPQEANIFATLSVWENLTIGAYTAPHPVARRAGAMFELFPVLGARRRDRAGGLSGGERQMLALAMALMTDPALLLLDEPSAGLAPALQRLTFERLREINGHGVSVLLVEQNARAALGLCHRGYVLAMGQTRAEGRGEGLLADPEIRHLYLGGST